MKKNMKITVSLLLAFVLLTGTIVCGRDILPKASADTPIGNNQFISAIKAEREKFKNGEYFAGNNKWYSPSEKQVNLTKSSTNKLCNDTYYHTGDYCNENCRCECGSYYVNGTWVCGQCNAYACQLGLDIFGIDPYIKSNKWKNIGTDVNQLKPGDHVRFLAAGPHSIFITDIIGDTVKYTQSNYNGPCLIDWDNEISKGDLQSKLNATCEERGIYRAPNNTISIDEKGLYANPESSNSQYTALVLDTSGSMSGTPIAKQKEAATSFCETLINTSSNNYVSIITFSSSASVKCDFTNDLNTLKSIINSTDASGTTNTNDALLKAGNKLQGVTNNNANKIIVLCSDGLPCEGARKTSGKYTGNDHDAYAYANAAYDTAIELKKSYEIYTLGFFHSLSGNDLTFGQKFMNDLQNEGYYNVNDPEQLTDVFEDIAKEIVDPGTSMEELLEKVVALLKNMFSVMLMLLQAALKAFTAATA